MTTAALATPPVAATGAGRCRIEFDEEEGIAFWVCISDEEAAIKKFPELFAERADAESVPAPDAVAATGEGDGR